MSFKKLYTQKNSILNKQFEHMVTAQAGAQNLVKDVTFSAAQELFVNVPFKAVQVTQGLTTEGNIRVRTVEILDDGVLLESDGAGTAKMRFGRV